MRERRIKALKRLRRSNNRPKDVVGLHELHARHERELGHHDNAARAEARARKARKRKSTTSTH